MFVICCIRNVLAIATPPRGDDFDNASDVATAALGLADEEPAKVDCPQTPDTKRNRRRAGKPLPTAEPASTPKQLELFASIPKTTAKREYKLSKLGAASKYQGVSWHGLARKWQASCKTVYIGLYGTEEEAAEARWQYEQIAKPEIEVASTPTTQLLAACDQGSWRSRRSQRQRRLR